MGTDTVTIAQFVAANRITSKAVRVDSNPNMQGAAIMDHWKVTLSMGRKRMTVYFSMGLGLKGAEPTAAEVLNALSMDSSGVDDHSFSDFCAEFGYEEDSRTAERTYKACQHSAKRLQNFLGTDLYGQLLYSTESL